ncbi:nucleoside recognition domain-containing protein [Hydrogenoanaerobacterium sp.]|uniref:nucleoside recognition domain-containing protein n=1 Tax=Hydrogenoanaerobacterium sp. TaxID=2953763 RepID=UPI0028A145A0|nr:nucleoside recognition domain-containing protein [Hydrogenoanaerobacterium sp.]
MMTWIFSGMILLSVVLGMMNDRISQVSSAALSEGGNAVSLVISLAGIMCLWSGLMNVAEKSGLTEKFSHFFSPVLRLLFKGLDPKSSAAKAISMNMAANLLGLGNAATPLGIAAMRELEALNRTPTVASNYMVTFVVLNTASLQLIPTTTAALRLQAGAAAPFDILPAVWITSIASVVSVMVMSRLLRRKVRLPDAASSHIPNLPSTNR